MKIIEKLTSFFIQCTRVWHILRKPSSEEFKIVAKVSVIGVLAIGLIGFAIAIIMTFFK